MEVLQRLVNASIRAIKWLVSDSNEVSHKRVIALASFLVLVGMVIVKAKGHPVDDNLIYVFGGLCGGNSILSVIEKKLKGN